MRNKTFTSVAVASTIVLLGALLASSGCKGKRGKAPSITAKSVTLELGTGPASDVRGWNVLRCVIRNSGSQFDGTVEIRGVDAGRVLPLTTRTRVSLPPDTRRRLELPVRAGDWDEVDLAFRQDSFVARLRTSIEPHHYAHLRVAAISDKPREFQSLVSFVDTQLDRSDLDSGRGNRDALAVDLLDPRRLPTQTYAYDGYQLAILWGANLSEAQDEELDALASWVERGGTLLAIPGESWGVQTPARLQELLGIVATDAADAGPESLTRTLSLQRTPSTYRPLAPRNGAAYDAPELAIVRRHGLGQITTLRYAIGSEVFPSPDDHIPTYAVLLSVLARAFSFPSNFDTGLASLESRIGSSLAATVDTAVPDGGKVFFMMLLYLIVGFIVPWAYFQRRQRRHWTFVVIAVVAILGVIAIGFLGFMSALPGRELAEVNVVRLDPASQKGHVTSFYSIISPRVGTFDPNPALDGPASVQPLRSRVRKDGNWGQQLVDLPIPKLIAEFDDEKRSTLLSDVSLYPNGPLFFRSDYTLDVSSWLDLKIEADDSGELEDIAVTVTNRSSRSLGAFLVDGAGLKELPPVEAGATVRWKDLRARDWALGHEDQELQEQAARSTWNPRWDGFARSLDDDELRDPPTAALQRGIRSLCAWTVMHPDDDGGADAVPENYWDDTVTPDEFTSPSMELWRPRPRVLLLQSRAPIFPDANDTSLREASTVFVVELPPRPLDD